MAQHSDYSFGSWIRHRRKILDLTQRELAVRLHCSVNTIKKVETDARRPSKQLAELLAVQLDIPPEQKLLFIECARGIRTVDSLVNLTPTTKSDQSPPRHRLIHEDISAAGSSIIGREAELEVLKQLLKDSRLVTITGPGGMGKSSLAQALVKEYKKTGERVAYILLAGLDSVEHIPFVIASTLRLDIPSDSDPMRCILAFLRSVKILLVFDNFEHLLDGVIVLDSILNSSPGTKLLVTSREFLGLPGEQVYPLHGLRFPEDTSDNSQWDVYPAIKLFVERSKLLVPNFEPLNLRDVVKICQLIEGLPLAIEIAASWVVSLSMSEIISELEHGIDILARTSRLNSSRHGSLRFVFDTSWQVLSEVEQNQFSSLCVFRGGFTRQAAEWLCGATKENLASLVSQSMIKFDYERGRYSIHNLLRMYGEDRLNTSGRYKNVQRLYAAYFSKLAGAFTEHLHSHEQKEWFDRLDVEQDNIRAALSFLLSNANEIVPALCLVVDLCWYWRIHSRVKEALKWLESALQIETNAIDLKAALYFHAGHFGWMQGDYDFAHSHQQESIRLWKSLGMNGIQGQAYSRHSLGMIASLKDDHVSAEQDFLTSLHLFEKINDHWGMAFAWKWLGINYMHTGRPGEAVIFLQKAEEYFRACGDEWALGLMLGFYGWLEFGEGNLIKAKLIAEEARKIRESWGHSSSKIDSIELLVEIAVRQGDQQEAQRLCHSALDVAEEIGNQKYLTYFRARLDSLLK